MPLSLRSERGKYLLRLLIFEQWEEHWHEVMNDKGNKKLQRPGSTLAKGVTIFCFLGEISEISACKFVLPVYQLRLESSCSEKSRPDLFLSPSLSRSCEAGGSPLPKTKRVRSHFIFLSSKQNRNQMSLKSVTLHLFPFLSIDLRSRR